MGYKVIKFFHDLQDTVKTKGGEVCHAYHVGDIYPREGYKPSAERIAELAGSDNKQGTPLIEMTEALTEERTVDELDCEEVAAPQAENVDAPQGTEEKPKRARKTRKTG